MTEFKMGKTPYGWKAIKLEPKVKVGQRILWVAEHKPLAAQVQAMRRYFGSDVEIVENHEHYNSGEVIVDLYQDNYDDIIVISRRPVLRYLIACGIQPWYPVMEELPNADNADLSHQGRHYIFVCFRRLREVPLDNQQPLQFVEGEKFP